MKPDKKGLSSFIIGTVVLCSLVVLFNTNIACSQRRGSSSGIQMGNVELNQMKDNVLSSSTTASNFNERFKFARSWNNALKRQGKETSLKDNKLRMLIRDTRRFRDRGDLTKAAALLDKVFLEFRRIENMSGDKTARKRQKKSSGRSQKGSFYEADADTATKETLPTYIRIAGFENLDASFQGQARTGTPPVMRPSRDAIEGKTSANIVFYGNNKGEVLGNYYSKVLIKLPEGALRDSTELSFWVKTSGDIEDMYIVFRERNGNVYKSTPKTVRGSRDWQRVVISIFDDLTIKQTSLKDENEFILPDNIMGFEIMLPVSNSGEFLLDKMQAFRRQAGTAPVIGINAIEDSGDDHSASSNKKMQDIASQYSGLANKIAIDAVTGKVSEETVKECRKAVGLVHEYKEAWEDIAGREETHETKFNYIRNKYILETIIKYNEMFLQSLEDRLSLPDGKLIEKKLVEKTSEVEIYEIKYMSDGLRVGGLLTKPLGTGVYPAIVTGHGGFGNAYFMSGERALVLARAGYVVFSPDYRGAGNSEGRPEARIEMSRIIKPSTHAEPLDTTKYGRRVLGIIHDIENAIKMTRDLSFVDGQKVAILGHSMGHIASRLVLERNSDLMAGVLIAAFIVEERSEIGRISSPVFLAYGDRDRVAPPQKGYELEDILKEYRKSVEIKIYKGKDHQTVIDACLNDAAKFLDDIMKKE